MARIIGFYLLMSVLQLSVGQDDIEEIEEIQEIQEIQKCAEPLSTDDKIRDLEVKIAQQNTKFADQNTKLAEQNIKLAEQKTVISELMSIIENIGQYGYDGTATTGSVFTRWGRRDCPSDISQLVYSGITGGSHSTHGGAAAEYVCLPLNPTWDEHKDYSSVHGSFMYGAEYEEVPKMLRNYDVPCAVCRSSQYSTVLMIPGRGGCNSGWMTAYSGRLVSGYNTQAAAGQYVCLDGDPQTDDTTSANLDGKLMYSVRAKCGSLPCPPYEDNALLTCAVCLK